MDLSRYVLSLPERALRSASALTGGLLRELGDITVPPAVRRTRLYNNMVESTLRFLIEQVGQVEGAYPEQGRLAEDFAIRRAAGNGIEFVGLLAFRASPVWVFAALSDLTGASRHLIREISESLQQAGLLERGRTFESVDQMLDGLEKTSGRLAENINTPPLDIAGLKQEWASLKREASALGSPSLPPPEALREGWESLKQEAAAQNRSVFELSSLMALSTVSRLPDRVARLSRGAKVAALRTGDLFATSLLTHYQKVLAEIHEQGFLQYWTREYRPYLRAAAEQFNPQRTSLTQRFLGSKPAEKTAEPRHPPEEV